MIESQLITSCACARVIWCVICSTIKQWDKMTPSAALMTLATDFLLVFPRIHKDLKRKPCCIILFYAAECYIYIQIHNDEHCATLTVVCCDVHLLKSQSKWRWQTIAPSLLHRLFSGHMNYNSRLNSCKPAHCFDVLLLRTQLTTSASFLCVKMRSWCVSFCWNRWVINFSRSCSKAGREMSFNTKWWTMQSMILVVTLQSSFSQGQIP